MLFVSTFTAATGALVLLILAEKLSPLELGLIAGLGATITDFMIFHFIKDGLMGEIEDLYTYYGHSKLHHLVHTLKSMRWMFPLLGAIIIASPLPDELGIGLMGISKIGKYKFLFLSFVLNSIGIMAILFTFYNYSTLICLNILSQKILSPKRSLRRSSLLRFLS